MDEFTFGTPEKANGQSASNDYKKDALGQNGQSKIPSGSDLNHAEKRPDRDRTRQQQSAKPEALPRLKPRSMTSVNQVLNKVVGKLGLDRRLKEHALMSLWPSVAGEMFATCSRPLFLDHEGNIVIAVKDASVGQELSLLKVDLAKKMRAMAKSLGIDVKGLRFDLKNFHNKEIVPLLIPPGPMLARNVTDAELASFTLTAEEMAELANLRNKLDNQQGFDLSQRIITMYERELRMKHWRKSQSLPICPSCREPALSLHGRYGTCRDCYFASTAQARDI